MCAVVAVPARKAIDTTGLLLRDLAAKTDLIDSLQLELQDSKYREEDLIDDIQTANEMHAETSQKLVDMQDAQRVLAMQHQQQLLAATNTHKKELERQHVAFDKVNKALGDSLRNVSNLHNSNLALSSQLQDAQKRLAIFESLL